MGRLANYFRKGGGSLPCDATLDDIAWRGLTYRNIFIEGDRAGVDSFESKSIRAYRLRYGTVRTSIARVCSGPVSVKVFGR